jgi:tRNA pseudouridine38-40 synthase
MVTKYRFAFLAQFLGTNFSGSQKQKSARTVQDEFEKALEVLFKRRVPVNFASRVDAGVHARAMVGHFDLFEDELLNKKFAGLINEDEQTIKIFCLNMNGLLPSDASILGLKRVDLKFNSIRDAYSRSYVYRLRCGNYRNPMDGETVAFLHSTIQPNLEVWNKRCSVLIGEHDFSGLSRINKSGKVNPVCRVEECRWERTESGLMEFFITADHFVYNMIRIIVGTQIDVENGKLCIDSLEKALKFKDRHFAGHTATAQGLCLEAIKYYPAIF